MIRPFGVVFAGPEAFPCSSFEYETREKHWPFYYCLIAWSSMCFDRHWPTISGGLILVALASRNHFGKKKKKRKNLLPLLLLFLSLFVFLVSGFSFLSCMEESARLYNPDTTGIFHFLMRSGVDSNAKRYLKEIWRHAHPWRYFQKIRGYWSFRHLTRMLFSWTINRSYVLFC